MSKLSWRTEWRRVADLIPNDQNPRVMSAEQTEALKRSLTKFNLVEIPVVDTDNKVVSGHQRLMVLKLLGRGEEKIEVRIPNRKLTKAEYDQYLLTSNRLHGDWDWQKLAEGFEIELLLDVGFDDVDLSHVWDDTLSIEEDNFDSRKAAAAIKKPKTKSGEMFRLGNHVLLCGDSTDPKVVTRVMGKHRIDMLYSDSPYNISLNYSNGISTNGKYGGKVDDNKSPTEYRAFLKSCIENAKSVAKPNAHFFMWCDQTYIGLLQSLYEELNIKNKRVCLWIKNNLNMTPKIAFNKAYESCVYGVIGSPYLCDKVMNLTEILNRDIQPGNRTIDDIVDLFDIWLAKRLNAQDYTTPTEKPVSLHEKPLKRCSKPGDIVLDLYGGSGSTMAACEQMKRKSFTIENDPIFCDVILQRYAQLTKTNAKRIG